MTSPDRTTAAYLTYRNQQQAAVRLRLGKAAVIIDASLEKHPNIVHHVGPDGVDNGTPHNEQAFHDFTDTRNEDFIYVL